MVRRVLVILATAVLSLKLGIPAAAAQTGSIRVSMDYGGPVDRGEVVLHAVAEPVESGYRLGEAFGGGIIRQEDACSPELAQWLAERSAAGGTAHMLDEEGSAQFGGLSQGLYLILQREAPEGWNCTAPFLVPLPLDGEWEVLACPKQSLLITGSPKTGQHPAPLFGAMGLVLSGMGLYLCIEKLGKK